MTLKLLSWNIWINGYFDQVADFLKESQADIIGLQEVVDDDPKRDIIGYLKKLGYYHVFASVEHGWGGKTYYDGPAVFSKYKIIKTETYVLSETNSRAAARADIQIDNKTFHVVNTHLLHTHQHPSNTQNEQVENLVKVLPSERTVVMGDFNATPESATIKKMRGALVDTDPSDTPTWSVYPAGCPTCNPQKIDTRLDYIFVSKGIHAHSFKVLDSKGSDHLPITVTIEV